LGGGGGGGGGGTTGEAYIFIGGEANKNRCEEDKRKTSETGEDFRGDSSYRAQIPSARELFAKGKRRKVGGGGVVCGGGEGGVV